MGDPVPNAPLTHANETEHRRQIADRANQNIDEQGAWTPIFGFSTNGDLSNDYTTQDGLYWRVGALVYFSFALRLTPTFTTSAGDVEISGFPYPAAAGTILFFSPIRWVEGLTWPAGLTDIVAFIRPAEQTLEVGFQGSAGGQNAKTTDVISGALVRMWATGFYSI